MREFAENLDRGLVHDLLSLLDFRREDCRERVSDVERARLFRALGLHHPVQEHTVHVRGRLLRYVDLRELLRVERPQLHSPLQRPAFLAREVHNLRVPDTVPFRRDVPAFRVQVREAAVLSREHQETRGHLSRGSAITAQAADLLPRLIGDAELVRLRVRSLDLRAGLELRVGLLLRASHDLERSVFTESFLQSCSGSFELLAKRGSTARKSLREFRFAEKELLGLNLVAHAQHEVFARVDDRGRLPELP